MPTELKRLMVSIPDELLVLLERDSSRQKKGVATMIMEIVGENYLQELGQPMLFGRSRRASKGSRLARPLVFGAPSRPEPVETEVRHASLGQEKS